MHSFQYQIAKLYILSELQVVSLTGAWVAILAARGFSLFQIGLIETAFHITSLLFEIPSGTVADVFGRKNTLLLISVMGMISNIFMITSHNFFMVCVAIIFNALSYNLSSGSPEALTYDALKLLDRTDYYEKFLSNQMIILSGIQEPVQSRTKKGAFLQLLKSELWKCFQDSYRFLLSNQKAALISIESFSFSVIMLIMSPLAGVLFTNW